MGRGWNVAARVEPSAALRQAVGGHPLVAALLAQRGFSEPEAALRHLDPALYRLTSPFELPGMETAIGVLRAAIARGGLIRVWGDYDADGQTATAVLVEALSAAEARVDYDLPRRSEGHGMAPRVAAEAARDGVAVLITCDTGIGDAEVVAQAVAAGVTVIVTDHHDLPPQLPDAHAIVNPKMLPAEHPLRELAGVGVAYAVALALLGGGAACEALLDITALGLVADVAHQVRDVRYLIQRGLGVMRAGARPGLRALAAAAELDLKAVDERDIGFQLGPRLNAAGRLDDARQGVRLLLTRDEAEANVIAQELEALNRDRRARTEAALAAAQEALRRDGDALRQPLLVVEGEEWEPGVLGLVAGELAREYARPAIVIAHRAGEASVASARSVEGIDIHAAIAAQGSLLLRQGGHPMAAGLSIERANVPAFRQGVLEWARALPARPEEALEIDGELPWAEAGIDTARELARLAPFGAGNPRPVLVARGGVLVRSEDVSRRQETAHRHLFLDADGAQTARVTWFNAGELPQPGEAIDVAFHLDVDRWHGQERARLELVDWRPAAHAPREVVATLVTGRDVIDWRGMADAEERLAEVRRRLGDGLVIWAEGVTPPPPGSVTRKDLLASPTGVLALAVRTAPPSGRVLRAVIARVAPQSVYLLPPIGIAPSSPADFVGPIAGMVRAALRLYEGRLDVGRMAARVAAREEAVRAALRGLELSGAVELRTEGDVLRAYLPGEAPAQDDADADEAEHSLETPAAAGERLRAAHEQARHALAHLLRETDAFRRAYATLPVEALLGAE